MKFIEEIYFYEEVDSLLNFKHFLEFIEIKIIKKWLLKVRK